MACDKNNYFFHFSSPILKALWAFRMNIGGIYFHLHFIYPHLMSPKGSLGGLFRPNRGYFFSEAGIFYEPFGLIGGIFFEEKTENTPIGGIFLMRAELYELHLGEKDPHRGYFFDGRTAPSGLLCVHLRRRTALLCCVRTCPHILRTQLCCVLVYGLRTPFGGTTS